MAPAFVITPRRPQPTSRPAGSAEHEAARAQGALEETAQRLEGLAEDLASDVGEEAEIFRAQAAFATDPELQTRIREAVDRGSTAEEAVAAAFDSFRSLLEQSANEYLAARARDIDDVRDQVIERLAGAEAETGPSSRAVVVAADLAPSQTARLPRDLIAGIACEGGSPTSHAAILAHSLGIPAVVGVRGLLGAVRSDVPVAIDGGSGEVTIEPDEEARKDFRARGERARRRREQLRALADEPCQTRDGHRVELAANIDGEAGLAPAREHGAEGAGLVRTELLFLEAERPPPVDVQTDFYRRILEGFPGQRVVVRTMDIGADKPLPFVKRSPEANPALGLRGLRLGLAEPSLLRDQLRGMLRAATMAAHDRLAVMFPLVARADEVDRALEVLKRAAGAEQFELDRLETGVMVEVPSAALAARALAERVDFLSIGTNDLLQYLFAADRLNPSVADIPDLFDPAVLRLIADITKHAHAADAWVGVCGEVAGDPVSAAMLVGLGVDELSATPAAIPDVKDLLRRVAHGDLTTWAAHALESSSAAEARASFEDRVRRWGA